MNLITAPIANRLSQPAQEQLHQFLQDHGINPNQTLACWTTHQNPAGDHHLHAIIYLRDDQGKRYLIPNTRDQIATAEVIRPCRTSLPDLAVREAQLLTNTA